MQTNQADLSIHPLFVAPDGLGFTMVLSLPCGNFFFNQDQFKVIWLDENRMDRTVALSNSLTGG